MAEPVSEDLEPLQPGTIREQFVTTATANARLLAEILLNEPLFQRLDSLEQGSMHSTRSWTPQMSCCTT